MKTLFSIIIVLSITLMACTKDVDFVGMFISNTTVNERFNQSIQWNSRNTYREITVPTDDYSFLSMGDCHVGGTYNLDKFYNIAKTRKAMAVVLVGDLVTGHVNDYSVFEKHLPSQDSMASFLIVGNHDLFFDGWKEFYGRFGSSSYLFTIKTPIATDLFICLDTGGGTLGDKQLEWLTNLLKTIRPKYRHCMVFTHCNFFRTVKTGSTNPVVPELLTLIELFTKNQVDMVITGHEHHREDVLFGITRYIVMDALKDGTDNAGFLQISVKAGNIAYKFEDLNTIYL